MPPGPSGPSWEKHTSQALCKRPSWAGSGHGASRPSPLLPHSGPLLPLLLRGHQHIPPCASNSAGTSTRRAVTSGASRSPGPASGHRRGLLNGPPALPAPPLGEHPRAPPSLRLVCGESSPPPPFLRKEIKATFALGPRVGPCLSSFQLCMDG